MPRCIYKANGKLCTGHQYALHMLLYDVWKTHKNVTFVIAPETKLQILPLLKKTIVPYSSVRNVCKTDVHY